MKIVHKEEAHKFEDGDTFLAHEYDTEDRDINTARIEIKGRYPISGSMRNTQVKEIVYIESGNGEISIDGIKREIKQGDVILYKKGEQVFWEGNFTLITTCTPAWSKDQHEFLQ